MIRVTDQKVITVFILKLKVIVQWNHTVKTINYLKNQRLHVSIGIFKRGSEYVTKGTVQKSGKRTRLPSVQSVSNSKRAYNMTGWGFQFLPPHLTT